MNLEPHTATRDMQVSLEIECRMCCADDWLSIKSLNETMAHYQ
jgi:hypothetical protein